MSDDQVFKQEYLGTFPAPYHRLAICKHCRLSPKDHGEGGKCLFEATYFELLRIPMKASARTLGDRQS